MFITVFILHIQIEKKLGLAAGFSSTAWEELGVLACTARITPSPLALRVYSPHLCSVRLAHNDNTIRYSAEVTHERLTDWLTTIIQSIIRVYRILRVHVVANTRTSVRSMVFLALFIATKEKKKRKNNNDKIYLMIYYNAREPMFLFGQLVSGSTRRVAARTM